MPIPDDAHISSLGYLWFNQFSVPDLSVQHEQRPQHLFRHNFELM